MKKLPIGISDFRKVIRDNNYFVDKSMLIHKLINSNAQVQFDTKTKKIWKNFKSLCLNIF